MSADEKLAEVFGGAPLLPVRQWRHSTGTLALLLAAEAAEDDLEAARAKLADFWHEWLGGRTPATRPSHKRDAIKARADKARWLASRTPEQRRHLAEQKRAWRAGRALRPSEKSHASA